MAEKYALHIRVAEEMLEDLDRVKEERDIFENRSQATRYLLKLGLEEYEARHNGEGAGGEG